MSVVRSALWSLSQFGAGRLVTFVSTVVLARLIDPDAFGLVAMGLLAINVFDRLKDLGLGSAVVRSPHRLAAIASTGNTLTMISSVLLAAVCFGAAPELATFLGDDRLTPIVRALALVLLISGMAVLPDAALRRRLMFKERTIPELSGASVKAVASIGLALAGMDVWSLVWGQVIGSITTTTLYWINYCRRMGLPGFRWSGSQARHLLGYGAPVSGIALLALVLDNLDYFVIGRRLGAEQLGYYTMAFRLPELMVISVCVVIGQVLFSSFSRMQDDLPALRRHYLSAASTVATICVPVGFGLSAAAPDIVQAILGDRFGDATGALRLLGIYAAIYSLSFHAGEVYKAIGRTRLMIVLSICRLVVFLPCLWLAAAYSIEAVAGTFLALQVIFTLVRLALIRAVLGLHVSDQWRVMWPPVLAAGVAAGVVFGLGHVFPSTLGTPIRLAVLGATGVALYVSLVSRFDRGALGRLRATSVRLRVAG